VKTAEISAAVGFSAFNSSLALAASNAEIVYRESALLITAILSGARIVTVSVPLTRCGNILFTGYPKAFIAYVPGGNVTTIGETPSSLANS